MAFKKAEPKQAFLKIALYGKQGSGKTFTTLLFAEGLAKRFNGRVAYVDTEHGTDYYVKTVPQRRIHPEAFDIDAIYTRSLSEVLTEIKAIDFSVHKVLVLDSITHMWEAAKNAYQGKMVGKDADKIPMHAWGQIKAPYKELINFLMNCPAHVFILGREGMETEDDDGEMKIVGSKMKAEGETGYEPNILIQMKQHKVDDLASGLSRGDIIAYFQKDRSGIFGTNSFKNPDYMTLEPLINLLHGSEQAYIQSDDEAAELDAGLPNKSKDAKLKLAAEIRLEYQKKLVNCQQIDELIEVWREIPQSKLYADDKHFLAEIKNEMKDKLSSEMFA